MRPKRFFTLSATFVLVICNCSIGIAQQSYSSEQIEVVLATGALSEGDKPEFHQAVETAVHQDRYDVLILALNNPNPYNKRQALDAIGKLSSQQGAKAFVILLKTDEFWVNTDRARSGTAQLSQDVFVGRVAKIISDKFGLSVSLEDMYDPKKRNGVMEALSKYKG